MRAAIAAESAGIPSVSIVCDGFVGQASATGRGLGHDGLSLAVMPGHVDAQTGEQLRTNVREVLADQVVAGLTSAVGHAVPRAAAVEPAALEVAVEGGFDDVQREFLDRGWSDGLPVVPPTRERVDAFIAPWGHDPWKVLGTASSSGRDVTVWALATNAVMAGCSSDHFPVLLAIAELLLDPAYGVEHSGNTTGADALILVSGPSFARLGFNSGQGALRDGVHANTSVGRWLRLVLRNLFDFTGDEHDKATFGNTFRVVLAEDHATLADLGWTSAAVDVAPNQGFSSDDDIVAIARMNSGAIVGSVFGSTPEQILPYLGDGVARVAGWDLTHVHGLGSHQFRPLLVLSPILARVFADAGWSRREVQNGLFEHARIPAWRFEKLIGEWSNLTPGRRTLSGLVEEGVIPSVYAESDDPDRRVPVATDPTKFIVAVAGDPMRTNAYAFSNDGPHGDWVARRVDWSIGSDPACSVPRSGGDA